uniref:Uncharacterized protein n=1 Tax=Candidatus Kentrum sp. MB TaxID=2138164 RepID=A0A450XD60_9GAMM|nr:MAG: hypothetical protein BECKMB1821G_GA0114241_101641 [Candidatus Kentron sp. MB]VFK27232.1 MAG: hypothetical protein BECKMB1821I_GA0114274_100292 [Candidatus Kentron sp. MB]VFK75104.1 MAG: hypothetical protein BECKMB1821H_GA0114242_101541 [Candidatus Kentron sp. MB]
MLENTNTTPEKKLLREITQLLQVENLPSLSGSEIRSLHKALPGYQAIADDTARFIRKHAQTLNLAPSVLINIEQGLAQVHHLQPVERLLEKLYLSTYHQRLKATSKSMGAVYNTARRIRNFTEAYPEVAEDGKFLLDFMKAFRTNRKKEKKPRGKSDE